MSGFSNMAFSYGTAPATGIVTSGLIHHLDAGNAASYPGTGTTWTDLVSANNCTLTNGVGYSSANGGILTFNGSNQYCVSSAAVNAGQNFTTEFFWRDDSPTSRGGLMADAYNYVGTHGWWLFAWGSNGMVLSTGADIGDYIISSIRSGVGTWYHWVVTCVSGGGTGNVKFYKNGVDMTSSGAWYGTTITFDYTTYNNYNIGSLSGSSDRLNGAIGIERMYNRALTSAEVTQNFNANKARYGL